MKILWKKIDNKYCVVGLVVLGVWMCGIVEEKASEWKCGGGICVRDVEEVVRGVMGGKSRAEELSGKAWKEDETSGSMEVEGWVWVAVVAFK